MANFAQWHVTHGTRVSITHKRNPKRKAELQYEHKTSCHDRPCQQQRSTHLHLHQRRHFIHMNCRCTLSIACVLLVIFVTFARAYGGLSRLHMPSFGTDALYLRIVGIDHGKWFDSTCLAYRQSLAIRLFEDEDGKLGVERLTLWRKYSHLPPGNVTAARHTLTSAPPVPQMWAVRVAGQPANMGEYRLCANVAMLKGFSFLEQIIQTVAVHLTMRRLLNNLPSPLVALILRFTGVGDNSVQQLLWGNAREIVCHQALATPKSGSCLSWSRFSTAVSEQWQRQRQWWSSDRECRVLRQCTRRFFHQQLRRRPLSQQERADEFAKLETAGPGDTCRRL